MVGIANRPGGYDESIVAFLEPLLATCATMVEAWTLERGRREMEAELAHARDEALESARLSAAILANMSHEIRTPLNVILGYTNLLDEQLAGRDEEVRIPLQSISRAGRRLTGLLQAILDLSRLEARALLPDPRPVDVEPLVRHMVEELELLAEAKGLRLRLAPMGVRAIARFDERSLQQILANLLQNAIKFTQSGEIRVSGRIAADGALEIAVADTGVGIDRAFFARLFEPFAQEELGYTRRFEGAGLGLALVKRYAELNGATIAVESEKRKGSTFTVRIPPHLVTVEPPEASGARLEGAEPGR
jgi:signal transduction histidine kinase